MENKTEEEMVYVLEIIHRLMDIYKRGTQKKANNKDSLGNYEIVEFMKATLPLIREIGVDVTYIINADFIDRFFKILFEHAPEEDK